MDTNKEIIFIGGPTAVGKSDVAFEYARRFNGEIISCDSMQVYKDINIATNKPSHEMISAIPHHLIDIIPLDQDFDVAQYYELAVQSIAEIHQRQRIPVVVGGSGLYMQILLDGIFPSGSEDRTFRAQLTEKAFREGKQSLYDDLQQVDPVAAQKIHPHDLRRVIRALEVSRSEQQPISALQKQRQGLWDQYPIFYFCLSREREELYQIINNRVDRMIADGLIDEISRISQQKLSRTARGIIGIKEIGGYLRGEMTLADALEQMKRNTRRLAKRQMTWFKKETRLQWINLETEDRIERIVAIIRVEYEKIGKDREWIK